MSDYRAPLKDMQFVLAELAGLQDIASLPGYEDATPDMVNAIIEGCARFHEGVIAPLNRIGDQTGSRIVDREVEPSKGFADAYVQFAEQGWTSVGMNPKFGGQGLPHVLASVIMEMTQSANLAFSLCPMLTQGASRSLEAHGSDALNHCYLPNMISGQWTGTMNLTEPQAGSDLAAVSCRAEPEGDHFRIRGQKIFITWGDHGMTENIIHLVLARTPDAPAGSAGISLFLVPKYLLNEDGSPGQHNDVYPASVEHKLGIHGSPTCVMSFGDSEGAVGYLVGEENRGLAHMFTMMNEARLDVGLQGLAVSERAFQQARDFARERVQGGNGKVHIIRHPDVRRMLMRMKSGCEAMRAVAYTTRASQDLAHRHPDADLAASNAARVDLMTPIVKGWLTEMANEITSLGIQVHGGMGYIEETGAAQHYRDARILAIYEGTNGIQALDLVGRKLLRDGGAAMTALLADMARCQSELEQAPDKQALATITDAFAQALGTLREAADWILEHGQEENLAQTVAFDFLMLAGYSCGGWQMARAALAAQERLTAGTDDSALYENKLATARFYTEHYLPRSSAHLATIKAGATSTMALGEDDF